jgi:hypothetical protein
MKNYKARKPEIWLLLFYLLTFMLAYLNYQTEVYKDVFIFFTTEVASAKINDILPPMSAGNTDEHDYRIEYTFNDRKGNEWNGHTVLPSARMPLKGEEVTIYYSTLIPTWSEMEEAFLLNRGRYGRMVSSFGLTAFLILCLVLTIYYTIGYLKGSLYIKRKNI